MKENKNIILISGPPNSGKSTSLRHLDQDEWAYMNIDGKELPFPAKFPGANKPIADARHIIPMIKQIEESKLRGGIVDTVTFLMTLYERLYVTPHSGSKQGGKAWGSYGDFYRSFIHTLKQGTKDYAVMAHEDTILNEQTGILETRIPVKGAIKRIGVEADFTTILGARQIPIEKLEGYKNDLLHITPEEEEDGIKYVFVTRITREYAGSMIRAPVGLWKREELYIDNDLNQVFKRIKEYYA